MSVAAMEQGHLRRAAVTVASAWPVVVLGFGMAFGFAVVTIPARQFAGDPDIVDLLVGWVILGAGAFIARQPGHTGSGLLLIAAGVAWFLPDLTRVMPGPWQSTVASTSLVHVTLLGFAALLLPTGRLSSRADQLALVMLLAAGLSAWTGGWQTLLPLAGLALAIAGVTAWRRPSTRANGGRPWAMGVAALSLALLVAALARAAPGEFSEQWLIREHELAVALTAVLLAVAATRKVSPGAIDVSFDSVEQLARVVADALSVRDLTIAVAGQDGRWLDVTGVTVDRAPTIHSLVISEEDGPVALLSTPQAPLPDIPPAVLGLLRSARAHARLRAAIGQQVDELDASRRRLLEAQDVARRDVRSRLMAGPLTRLTEVESCLAHIPQAVDLREHAARARENLEELALGLEPFELVGSLPAALEQLARHCPSAVELSISGPLALDPTTARTVWFTVCEAVTNAVKHAPGAAIRVDVQSCGAGARVVVSDDGPGGADPRGSGLRGLADRAEAHRGTLRVVSSQSSGTTLELVVR